MYVMFIVLFLTLSLASSAMASALSSLSMHHLKHLAKKRDDIAVKLYPLKARGSAVWLTLELFRTIFLVATICMLATKLSPWLLGILIGLIIFFVFSVFLKMYLEPIGTQLLIWFSEPILEVTQFLKFVTLPLGRALDGITDQKTRVLTRQDLLQSLASLDAEDTNLSKSEINLLRAAMNFSDLKVEDVMVPKRKLKLVKVDEVLTPVVLDELHRNGQNFFPVIDKEKEVVGMLAMKDVMDIHSQPEVMKTMGKAVFVLENDRLEQVLREFYDTSELAFVVKSEADGFSGIVSLEAVMAVLFEKNRAEEVVDESKEEVSETQEQPEQIAQTETDVVE